MKKLLFKGGYADITPANKLPLAGYASRKGAFSRVADRLEADVAIVSDGTHRSVIISCDLLYVGRGLSALIADKLGGTVSPRELFITATHTHFAPATDSTKPKLGETSSEYVEFVAERIAGLVRRLLSEKMDERDFCYSRSHGPDITMNRMNHGFISLLPPKMDIKPKLDGFKDDTIHIIRIADEKDLTKAIIWNYSCHPVGFYDLNAVSSEFPGAVRDIVRKDAGEQVPVLFLQGFSGDIRPFLRTGSRKSFFGPVFKGFDEPQYRQWTGVLGKVISDSARSGCGKSLEPTLKSSEAEMPLAEIGLQGSDEPIRFKSIDIGDVKLVGISAEPVAEYVPIMQNYFPKSSVVPVGCLGHVFGYLPTSEMLGEKEYEVRGFQEFFNLNGSFDPRVQQKVEKAIGSL